MKKEKKSGLIKYKARSVVKCHKLCVIIVFRNEKKQIINLNRVEVFERVRDLRFNNKKLYLFMEDTASIGVIDLN